MIRKVSHLVSVVEKYFDKFFFLDIFWIMH
jgi:hypothetical protein